MWDLEPQAPSTIYIHIYIYIYIYILNIIYIQYCFVTTHALKHMIDGWLHIAGTNEPKCALKAKQGA